MHTHTHAHTRTHKKTLFTILGVVVLLERPRFSVQFNETKQYFEQKLNVPTPNEESKRGTSLGEIQKTPAKEAAWSLKESTFFFIIIYSKVWFCEPFLYRGLIYCFTAVLTDCVDLLVHILHPIVCLV